MSVSTITRSIDLTGEFTDIGSSSFKTDDGHLEQTEFEDFTSQDEYAEPNDAKRLNRRLSVKKRNAFFQCFGSIAVTLIFSCFAVPGLGDFMIKNVKAGMIVCTAFLAAVMWYSGGSLWLLPPLVGTVVAGGKELFEK